MPEVTILFKARTEPVRENIQRELLWHDDIRGELLTFHGGELGFEYKEDEYLVAMGEEERRKRGITSTFRMLPVVKDLEVVNYNKTKVIDQKEQVEKWLSRYMAYNDTNISIVADVRAGLVIDVPEEEADDFLYDAERNGIGFVI